MNIKKKKNELKEKELKEINLRLTKGKFVIAAPELTFISLARNLFRLGLK